MIGTDVAHDPPEGAGAEEPFLAEQFQEIGLGAAVEIGQPGPVERFDAERQPAGPFAVVGFERFEPAVGVGSGREVLDEYRQK